jgi:hypothetical protein
MILPSIHPEGLVTSTTLSGYFMAEMIPPLEVISILNAANVRFMLVGAYGLVGWTRTPRATQDVDVLVATRGYKKAIKALLSAFPQLEAEDYPVVTRLHDRESQQVIIDVLKPNQPLYREALKHTSTIQAGAQSYQIPTLEMALAMKFAPMISLTREDKKKHLDAHDFIAMVEANPDIDLEKLAELGDLVYPGGGLEIVEKVRQVRAGETLQL